MRTRIIGILATAVFVVGCITNPVTGKKEVRIVGEDWEIGVGKEQYAPLRQSQGGDYVVDPAVERYVDSIGQKLAKVADRKLPYEFNVINDSTPNAWALPGGKISINRGLLVELQNEAELAAVLGHEIVHAAAGHGARGVTRGAALQAGVVAVLIGTQGKVDPNVAQLGAGIGAQLINSKYGRDAELESDRYGIEYMHKVGYDPSGAVTLQEAFVRLSEGRQQDQFSRLFASHPPSTERVAKNKQLAAKLSPGGDLGRERYQRVMAKMLKAQPAYEKYEDAKKAFADGKEGEATRLVREAIRIEPNEGHFHSFLGDLARTKKQFDASKRSYDRAIQLNPNFFYYYLGRGQLFGDAGQQRAAKADLTKSMQLLPTSAAQAALGNIAAVERDFDAAKKYYRAAASGGGEVGQNAMNELMKLDLADNPGSYIQTAVGLRNGEVIIQVKNPSPNAVTGLAVQLANTTSGQTSTQRMQGTLGAGKTELIRTGLKWPADRIKQLKATVVSASLAG